MGKFDTHGGYFAPKDYFRINTGGSHSENPNGGVQIGIDQNGVPNLLEEGEPVFKDFVFSDNIKANKSILKDMSIPEKYAGMLYSEIADKFIEEAEMRPMDPISNNGLRAMLSRLADAQEEQKLRKEENELKAELKKLSPEELQAVNTMLVQQEQANPQEQAMLPQMQVGMPQDIQQVPQEEYAQQAPVIMANGGLLAPYTANYFEDGTPGEEKPKRKINWERVGGIAAGSLAGAGAGAMQGLSGGPWGAAGLGLLGAISGGSAAANLYDGDYLGAALDLASMGAGKGIMMTGRKALGMVPKAASLESVMKGAQKAAIQSAKLTAKKDAVKVAEGEVKQAVKDVTVTSKNLEKQRKAIETLVAKGENLSAAEKKALDAAKKEYQTAAKQVESNSRNLLDAESSMRKASRKLWWAEHIKNPLPAIGRGIQKADNWVWDNASSYLFDPSKLAGKSPVIVHAAHALPIFGVDVGVLAGNITDKAFENLTDATRRNYVELPEKVSVDTEPVEEEFANPFENFAEGGNLPTIGRQVPVMKDIALLGYNMAQQPDRYISRPVVAQRIEGNMPLLPYSYHPTDTSIASRDMMAVGNSTARQIRNSGLGPATGATLLANAYAVQNALGRARLEAEQAERQQRLAYTQAANADIARQAQLQYGINSNNAQMNFRAQQLNRANDLQLQGLNYQSEQDKSSALQVLLDSISKSIYENATQNFNFNMFKNNPGNRWYITPDGRWIRKTSEEEEV